MPVDDLEAKGIYPHDVADLPLCPECGEPMIQKRDALQCPIENCSTIVRNDAKGTTGE